MQRHTVAGRLWFWQEWTATPGSHNSCYVNPFVRGLPTPAGLRFSSTVVRGIEIAIFVAKWDPVVSDFDRIPSLKGNGFRKTGADSAQAARWPALPCFRPDPPPLPW